MRRTRFGWIFMIGLLIILTACTTPTIVPVENQSQGEEQQPPADSAQESTEGELEDTAEEDATSDGVTKESEVEASVLDPAAIFSSKCAGCHSADRSGARGPSLLPERLTQEASFYANIITSGKGGMPTWADRLSAEEINALAEWILTEGE